MALKAPRWCACGNEKLPRSIRTKRAASELVTYYCKYASLLLRLISASWLGRLTVLRQPARRQSLVWVCLNQEAANQGWWCDIYHVLQYTSVSEFQSMTFHYNSTILFERADWLVVAWNSVRKRYIISFIFVKVAIHVWQPLEDVDHVVSG